MTARALIFGLVLGLAAAAEAQAQAQAILSLKHPYAELGILVPVLLDDQSQPSGQQPAASPSQAPAAGQKTPEPYTKDEFPAWLQRLWRAEVIFVGSLPFTYFFSLEGYDVYRWAALKSFDPAFAPWPFRPSAQILYDTDETFLIVAITLSFSGLVTAADFVMDLLLFPDEKN